MLRSHRHYTPFRTSARGLEAQRIAMATAAENIANASTTRTADGTPYRIKRAVHELEEEQPTRFSRLLSRSRMELQTNMPEHSAGPTLDLDRLADGEMGPLTDVEELERYRREYDPTHPDADADGYVLYPDVNMVEEMTRMISANRIYEANLTAVEAAKEMLKRTLEI
ncbi:MAG: flagellar basal body rod protein FlgC [Bacteroidota bacterium]